MTDNSLSASPHFDNDEQTKSHTVTHFSKLGKEEKLKKAKKIVSIAISADAEAQKDIRKDFKYDTWDQWDEKDKQYLANQTPPRPALTFNMLHPMKELLLGIYEENKMEIRVEPQERNDQFLADVLNDCMVKLRDIDNSEEEEADARDNIAVCGRGHVAVDYKPDPKHPGEIIIDLSSIYPPECRMDKTGRKSDHTDRSYFIWEKWVTLEDFLIKWPEQKDNIEKLVGLDKNETMENRTNEVEDWELAQSDEIDEYHPMYDADYFDKRSSMIRVVLMEYWEPFNRHYMMHPLKGEWQEVDNEKIKLFKKVGYLSEDGGDTDFYHKIMDKKCRWMQFTGHEILSDDDSPIPYDGFGVVTSTGYKDKSGKILDFYGLYRPLEDAQDEINKRYSHTLYLLLSQKQGGIRAEIDGPVDMQQFEQAEKTGDTSWMQPGALGQGKVQDKELPQLPVATERLVEQNKQTITQVSGINPDMLAWDRAGNTPGVVIRLQHQQGVRILQGLFKAFNFLQAEIAKRIAAIICAKMPESQLVRILGNTKKYQFQQGMIIDVEKGLSAPIRNIRDLRYNIFMQESQGNLTKQMYELSILMELLSTGAIPVDPKVLIDKLDLSAATKADWQKYIEQAQQSQQQAMQAQMQMQFQDVQSGIKRMQDELALKFKEQSDNINFKFAELAEKGRIEDAKVEQDERESVRDYKVDLAKLEEDREKPKPNDGKGLS